MTPSKGWLIAGCLILGATAASAEMVGPKEVVYDDFAVTASLTGKPGDPIEGRIVFADRKLGNCLACHANEDLADQLFHGEVGPVMDGVGDRWSPEELRGIVVNSKQVFGPETVMPAFYRIIEGQRIRKEFVDKTILTAEQVEDVVAYLSTLKEE